MNGSPRLLDVTEAVRIGAIARLGTVTYFVQAVDGGPIKIGKSSGVGLATRLRGLQCGNPRELRFTRILRGDVENFLHSEFAADRIRGEWFRPSEWLCEIAHAIPEAGLTAHDPHTNHQSEA